MLSDTGARLKIVQGMKNPYDYAEFEEICGERNITPLPVGIYAQKIGMIMLARVRYPGKEDRDAYLALVAEMNRDAEPSGGGESPANGKKSGCVGCGGGTVR